MLNLMLNSLRLRQWPAAMPTASRLLASHELFELFLSLQQQGGRFDVLHSL